jgi:hypothetical protein
MGGRLGRKIWGSLGAVSERKIVGHAKNREQLNNPRATQSTKGSRPRFSAYQSPFIESETASSSKFD